MVTLSEKIKSRILQLQQLQHNTQTQDRFASYWTLLKQNELFLLDFMDNTPIQNGNIVLANMLYVLNHEVDVEMIAVLKLFGLPASEISTLKMESFLNSETAIAGHVEIDGILCQDTPFAGLDPNWIELFLSYIWYQEYPAEYALFATTPAHLIAEADKPMSIAIFGDWGTGAYNDCGFSSPSTLVARGILSLQPDISVHLGDVYYAGAEAQISDRLLKDFPAGTMASFTMNGNHEMFDGANAYFKTALSNPVFLKQQQTSYFAVQIQDYFIIGLDTAYFDASLFHLAGTVSDQKQLEFIKSLQIKPHQKIILLTHHNALSLDGSKINDPLFSQIYSALGNRYPDYWYYGHMHNGVVYNNSAVQGGYICNSGLSPQIRCFGHASIPIGKAYGLLDEKDEMKKGIDYFASTPLPNPDNKLLLSKRVKNGFMLITIHAGKLTEQVYEVSEDDVATCVWTNTLT